MNYVVSIYLGHCVIGTGLHCLDTLFTALVDTYYLIECCAPKEGCRGDDFPHLTDWAGGLKLTVYGCLTQQLAL